jgi:hypothetical protein
VAAEEAHLEEKGLLDQSDVGAAEAVQELTTKLFLMHRF